jgi:hypothetical protein
MLSGELIKNACLDLGNRLVELGSGGKILAKTTIDAWSGVLTHLENRASASSQPADLEQVRAGATMAAQQIERDISALSRLREGCLSLARSIDQRLSGRAC